MPKMSVLSFALLGTYGKLRLSLLLLGLLNMIYIYKGPGFSTGYELPC